MTSWMFLLGTSIVLPILILLGSITRDLGTQIAVADGERQGLTSIAALGAVFEDASRYTAHGCGGARPGSVREIERDVAAMNRQEASHRIDGDDWKAAAGAWRSTATPQATGVFVDNLAGLFATMSDRSGLTYDPDAAGIDLADALTYRLPIAIQQLQHARMLLCSPNAGAVGQRLRLSQSAGHAEGYLGDGLSETLEATRFNREFAAAVGADERRAEASTSRALVELAAFEDAPGATSHAAAGRAVERGIADLYALFHATGPALGQLIVERRNGLVYRRFQTIVLGIIAMGAASLIVLLGARSALHRAELGRIRRSAEELRHHATHDMLTGLPNRTALVAAVDARLDHMQRHGGAVAALFIDLDNFKLVNDSMGHEAGDSVLTSVSHRLRAIGAEEGDSLVARFGGDEFAMVLADPDPEALVPRVERLVEKIATALANPVAIRAPFDQQVVISASVGIAFRDGRTERSWAGADLLREADAAMYEAKASGRARAETFGPAMRERATRKLMLMTDLRGAAERGELHLEFQPCVRLCDAQPLGSEALIRWNHPRLGLLMPGAFLPIADESGSLVSLGRWAIDAALQAFAEGRTPPGTIHVNVSVRELLDDTLDFFIGEMLERYRVPPPSLAIEVIEGSLIRSGDRAERMLRRLRRTGAKIWIDDFGVEYSSLRYLHRLPIDGVKIDRTFVGGADGSLASPSIVRLIMELAGSLGLGVIAEGVETEVQRTALLGLGCAQGQGYLFAAPQNTPNAASGIA
jgi:diguanylate cyclase (GGDEF)-like protein